MATQSALLSSERGRAAETLYRSEIVASRVRVGRASYESARAAWAVSHGLQPDDGLYLGELTDHPKNLQEVTDAVETCGKSREDTRLALERIFEANLIVADPIESFGAAAGRPRWP